MAEGVVDPLEIVDVDDDQRALGFISVGARDFAGERFVESTVVRDSGEAVGAGLEFCLQVDIAVFDDRGHE